MVAEHFTFFVCIKNYIGIQDEDISTVKNVLNHRCYVTDHSKAVVLV